MKKIENCPNCDSKEQTKFLNCIDNTYSKETFTIVKCSKCDLAFTNPIPEIKDLGKYYESKEYISHTNNNKGWFNTLYQIARLINIKSKLKTIGYKKGNLLEIGSGTGELIDACKKAGWKTTGIEPSMKARKNAKDNLNLELFEHIDQAKLKDKSQDIIMMWHVLEHIPNLKETTQKINRLLKDDGRLIIAVPNYKSYDANHYKENWAAYDVPRHLLHFNKNTMAKVLNRAGLKVVKTKAMWLDSLYVSMLSEKIKTGERNPIKAIGIGIASNLKGLLKTKEYSSLIYIAKKGF
jgi:2-polyprenyl-3-methyl-5-hydroxy-6-metoxy-1,4-benzoquinol methylase